MNILFLTLSSSIEEIDARGIYNDLVRELSKREMNIYVVSPREKRIKLSTELVDKGNIKLLRVRTGNITKTNKIEKGISTLSIEKKYLKAIKKYFPDVSFDMVLYSTPPITFYNIIKYYKSNQKSKTYLMLKDIFPQNAVDIGLINKNSLIWRYFRQKEKKLYSISDYIGCMSLGNLEYIYNNNDVPLEKLEVFPNSIKPIKCDFNKTYKPEIHTKYNIPKNATLFVYGGNLGKPQGVDFLIDVIKNFHKVKNAFLLIVGAGTEFERIKNFINSNSPKNVSLYEKLPKKEYDQLLEITDVGLIFLDNRFTIPNIPSRLTAYFEHSIPVLAATDKNTDLKDILLESNSGLWSESGDLNEFIINARKLASNRDKRINMGMNARKHLENNFDITKTIDVILKHL